MQWEVKERYRYPLIWHEKELNKNEFSTETFYPNIKYDGNTWKFLKFKYKEIINWTTEEEVGNKDELKEEWSLQFSFLGWR